ncbi:hypothetical protein DYBT9275_00011 [Dyadobacter sp. CECT 9275]|uniref:Uncharacterized protein n=1 Tax=Dyadobacter helix TaxID=2822344 RepID=A0A916JAS1_9BACT|nr:hypothetical protein DYBT9275_00011 [Dyadobacter sp. CECT 9275]
MLIVELAIPFTRLVRAKNMVDSTAFSNLSGGQFTPESGGQFDPKWGGQFRPEQVVSLNRIGVVSFTEFSSMTFNISLEIRPFPSGNGWMANSR